MRAATECPLLVFTQVDLDTLGELVAAYEALTRDQESWFDIAVPGNTAIRFFKHAQAKDWSNRSQTVGDFLDQE